MSCTLALDAYRSALPEDTTSANAVAVVQMGPLRAVLRQPAAGKFGNPPYVVTDSTYSTVIGLYYK